MTTTETKPFAPVKHNHQIAFGRREPGCPRCDELAAGAPARQGWGRRAKTFAATRSAAIYAHDCRRSGCGPVCTFGDW